jgi:hypothetical protein
MTTRKWVVTIVAVLAVWMGGYAFLARDPDATAYRELCVTSAQGALDGLGTARLATDSGVLPTVKTSLDGDAQKLIQQARSAVVGQIPPDRPSARRRDTLVPLLDQAERLYEDLATARTDADVRAVTGRMAELEGRLRDFVDGNR